MTFPKRRNLANIIIAVIDINPPTLYHWITRSVSPSLGGK